MTIQLTPLEGLPVIEQGMNLVSLLCDELGGKGTTVGDRPVLTVAHKIVSKAEGCLRPLQEVSPSPEAREIAEDFAKDPRLIQVVLDYAAEILHVENGTIIAETPHGFVCANAGVDSANVRGDFALLPPENPDRSARKLSEGVTERLGVQLPVIVSDTWGRPWREGQVNFAIGVHGLSPIEDYRGETDVHGQTLKTSRIGTADEIASAAELLMGKTKKVPAVLMTGYDYEEGSGVARDLVRDSDEDFFR